MCFPLKKQGQRIALVVFLMTTAVNVVSQLLDKMWGVGEEK
jgi:hypothetical protein